LIVADDEFRHVLEFAVVLYLMCYNCQLENDTLMDWLSKCLRTNFDVIFFRKLLNPSNCIHHLLPPLEPLKSHLGLEKQPRILDPVTVLTATNL